MVTVDIGNIMNISLKESARKPEDWTPTQKRLSIWTAQTDGHKQKKRK